MKTRKLLALCLIAVFAAVSFQVFGADDAAKIDWNKAQQIYKKKQGGEKLSAEEQIYLQKAIEARQKGSGGGNQNAQGPGANAGPDKVKDVSPLTEMTAVYKGEDGGLYGNGKNEPPETQKKLAEEAGKKIKSLSIDGTPSENGKIVLLTIGMSNTSQESDAFLRAEKKSTDKNPALVLVNGAQGGMTPERWVPGATTEEKVWQTVEERLRASGVSLKQVQAVWLKEAIAGPEAKGAFPAHAKYLLECLAEQVKYVKVKCPNLQIVYLSSRIYGGYANTRLNPEPYAFESAFSVRWLILGQIRSYKEMTAEGSMPVLLWGPYLWGNGTTPRKDGLVWEKGDLGPDGTHPSQSGTAKVAKLLSDFFRTEPSAKEWFFAK